MVKLLKVLVTGDEIDLLPFAFEKPQYADIPKAKEYTSQNEHTLFANKNTLKVKDNANTRENAIGENEGNEILKREFLHNMKKSRKYFANINIKKATCFEKLMKKLKQKNIVKSYYVKETKKGNAILYVNKKKLGKLEDQIKIILKKYKKIHPKNNISE